MGRKKERKEMVEIAHEIGLQEQSVCACVACRMLMPLEIILRGPHAVSQNPLIFAGD